MQSIVGVIDGTSNHTLANSTYKTCIAEKLHSTFIRAEFIHHDNLAELVSLQIVPYLAIATAAVIAAVGHKIMRPSVCILGFCAGSMATLHVLYTYASSLHNWSCDGIVAASFTTGGIAALIGATLVSAISVILGCMAGASLCILLFHVCTSCNDSLWPNAPLLLGKSLIPFWITFITLGIAGGYACRRRKATIVAFVTSVIGAWGVVAGSHLAAGAQNNRIPSWASILIAIGTLSMGFSFQMWLIRRKAVRPISAPRIKRTKAQQSVVQMSDGQKSDNQLDAEL